MRTPRCPRRRRCGWRRGWPTGSSPRSERPLRVLMNGFFLDPRAARITWTILVFVSALGLAYAVRSMLLLVALSLFFAYLLFPLVRLTQRWVVSSRALAIA